jgi:hypothetical protein
MRAPHIGYKHCIWYLIAFWGACQFIAYLYFGVETSVDTPHYVALADQLLSGKLPEGSNISYASYVFLIALFRFLNFPIESIAIIQIIVAGLSVFVLHQLTFNLSKSSLAALFATLLYCLWPKFYQWNLIIYTDSLFASMVLLSFYWLHKSKSWRQYLFTFLLVLTTVFLRPPGLGLLFAVLVWGGFKFESLSKSKYQVPLILLSGLVVFSIVLNTILASFIDSFISSYQAAEVIYPNIEWLVSPKDKFIIPSIDHPPLLRLVEVYWYNPVYMTKLCFAKVGLLLSHAKPYYSSVHNLLIGLFLLPTYFLAFVGIIINKKQSFTIVLLSFLAFQITMVGLTSENWDGRFLLPILSIVFLFAGLGLKVFLEKLKFSKN